jgi:hypothetical protein
LQRLALANSLCNLPPQPSCVARPEAVAPGHPGSVTLAHAETLVQTARRGGRWPLAEAWGWGGQNAV